MKHYRQNTNGIAAQRLKQMQESCPLISSQELLAQMKDEIAEVFQRYLDVPFDQYEIKVVLSQKQERV